MKKFNFEEILAMDECELREMKGRCVSIKKKKGNVVKGVITSLDLAANPNTDPENQVFLVCGFELNGSDHITFDGIEELIVM